MKKKKDILNLKKVSDKYLGRYIKLMGSSEWNLTWGSEHQFHISQKLCVSYHDRANSFEP